MATKFKVGNMYSDRGRPDRKIFRFLMEVPDAAEDQRAVFVRSDTGVVTLRSSEGKFLANRDCDYDIITQPESVTIYGAIMKDDNGAVVSFSLGDEASRDDLLENCLQCGYTLIKKFEHTETYED